MIAKFEQTKKDSEFIGYKIMDAKNKNIGICYAKYWDNDDDIIFNISLTDSKYLEESYEFISKEIFINFKNIRHIITEVYKSNKDQIDFYLKNDFVIAEDESVLYPKIENPLLLLQLII